MIMKVSLNQRKAALQQLETGNAARQNQGYPNHFDTFRHERGKS